MIRGPLYPDLPILGLSPRDRRRSLDPAPCETCDGFGVIELPVSAESVETACPACDGEGS